MLHKATRLIDRYFENRGIRHQTHEFDSGTTAVLVELRGNLDGFIVQYLSRDDDNDVSVRVYRLLRSVSNKASALVACNFLNNKYRFVKFVLDDDDDLNLELDFPISISDDDVGKVAYEIQRRIENILGESKPVLDKARSIR